MSGIDTPLRDAPIAAGETIPAVSLRLLTADGMQPVETDRLFAEGVSVLFGVPGAYTPTCSGRHVPGFLEQADAFAAKGVARLVCLSVNDPFVMRAWGDVQGVGERIMMLPDGNADFTRALGLQKDAREVGLGLRCKRFAMIIDGDGEAGRVRVLAIDDSGLDATSAEKMLARL